MRALLLTLLLLLPLPAVAGLSIVPRSFDYELNHSRGAAIPLSVTVANDGEAREAWVLVVVHDVDTGEDVEIYSAARTVPAGGSARFGAAEGLVARLPRDGVYATTAIVFTAGADGDVRAAVLHETRPLYVGAYQRAGCR